MPPLYNIALEGSDRTSMPSIS